jgi:prepilin-type processing-associated H-X9-DG protein
MHIYAYMEETTLQERIYQGATIFPEEMEQACPWDNLDGLPERRPEIDSQSYIGKFMKCPSSPASRVMYNDQALENLLKGNYAACFGGGTMIDASPNGNPGLKGVFSVVPGVKKYPIGERFGIGKGTAIGHVQDGTSNTVMLSEVLPVLTPDSRGPTSSMPEGRNRDPRGVMLFPTAGGNTFMGAFPPNSRGTDVLISCDPAIIPPGMPEMMCTQQNSESGAATIQAAARSRHMGGVNAAFADGSVKFIRNGISPAVWWAMCTMQGGETVNDN